MSLSNNYLCKDSSITFVFSLESDSFEPSMADLLLSVLEWPKTVLPVAFDMVFDFVMRDLGGVEPGIIVMITKNLIILLYNLIYRKNPGD